jgi:hypothetical protein
MIKVLHIHPVTVLFFEILGAFIFGIGAFFLQRKKSYWQDIQESVIS